MFQKGERMANVKFAQYQGTVQLFWGFLAFFTMFFYYYWQQFFSSKDGRAVDIEKYSAITDELEFISPIRFQSKSLKENRSDMCLCRPGEK